MHILDVSVFLSDLCVPWPRSSRQGEALSSLALGQIRRRVFATLKSPFKNSFNNIGKVSSRTYFYLPQLSEHLRAFELVVFKSLPYLSHSQ
jgi:hypothetical protein